jgi:NAD(P)-dependent dehydrogenase (short-subunit alcohol dehydrogenase family)
MRLENKVALVTGGSSGIGRSTAVIFAKEGAKVVISDVDEAHAVETVDEVRASGGTAMAAVGDVASSQDAERMVRPPCRPMAAWTFSSTAPGSAA